MKKILWFALPLALLGVLCWPGRNVKSQTTAVTLIGAGDIADGFGLQLAPAFAAAALLDANPGATVMALGDLAYNEGEDRDFIRSYDATWGRARLRTIPVAGNHEYAIQQGTGYYDYWGPVAGNPSQGWYSLNFGAWHVIVLNSNCGAVGCAAGGAQETWLRNDLAANTQLCTLALWHEPMYTSSTEIVPATDMQPMWIDLFNAQATFIVNGHAHNYERFAPQDPFGNFNPTGIIEIVVGTGGGQLFPFNRTLAPNSLVQNSSTWGVLKLTLNSLSVNWQFIPIAGQTFTDSGTQPCA